MPRAGLTPDSVLDAASEIADAEGLAGVTLARVAAKLGVRPPSLYKHVDGLDAIHHGLALRGLREATARVQRATVGKAGDDALFAFARAYWQFARDRPGIYAASLRAARPGENDIAAAGEALIGLLLSVLAGYNVKGDDALHATRGLRAIIHGFVSLDAAGDFRLKLDLDESLSRLLNAVATDLRARGQKEKAA